MKEGKKMDSKKQTTMSGTLLLPLCVGNRAIIFHDGGCTSTSVVVAIHSLQPGDIRFETKNTHYRLLTGPSHQPAVSLFPVAMAA